MPSPQPSPNSGRGSKRLRLQLRLPFSQNWEKGLGDEGLIVHHCHLLPDDRDIWDYSRTAGCR